MMLQTATLCWFLVTVASTTSSSSQSNEDFDLNIVEHGTHFTEKVTVDVERNVEEIDVPPHNDIKGTKFIHDFNRNLTMRLTTGSEHCFLQDLSLAIEDGYAVQPQELLGALRHAKDQPPKNGVRIVANHWAMGDRVGEEDVSLSPEMRSLCLGRAIYWLQHLDDSVSVGSHPHNGSRLIRHRRQSPQCAPTNIWYRCKKQLVTNSCAYVYYQNCEQRLRNTRRGRFLRAGYDRHCADSNTLHIYDNILCCKDCCKVRSQADNEFFPFCDSMNNFSCHGMH